MAQTEYQMNDIDYVNILDSLVFQIAFDKVEESCMEKPSFQGGYKKTLPGTDRVKIDKHQHQKKILMV